MLICDKSNTILMLLSSRELSTILDIENSSLFIQAYVLQNLEQPDGDFLPKVPFDWQSTKSPLVAIAPLFFLLFIP